MNTPILNIKDSSLGRRYRLIGYGDEGKVYNYEDHYAIKIFNNFDIRKAKSKMKLAKLEEMSKIKMAGVSLPIGLVVIDGKICGCFSKLVDYIEGKKDFNYLDAVDNTRKLLDYIIAAEDIMKRLHEQGFALGDIRRDNIMLDRNNNPVFIDTDNYAYKRYPFDMIPDRAGTLYNTYNGPIMSLKDNDILVFTIMALRILTKNPSFEYSKTKEELAKALNKLRFSKYEKEVIDEIFSDSTNKPYFGSIL